MAQDWRAGARTDRAAGRDQQQGVRRLSREQGDGGRDRAEPPDGIDAARRQRDPDIFVNGKKFEGPPTVQALDEVLSGLAKSDRARLMRADVRPAMQVERLRLAGFKSFVDPTELAIAPGLTGIVGPNGCGKSNLVEALRWVMGEASARRLRGGEMDDVIFGGSDSRPARNLAEVALTVDNSARDAPLAFNDSATIEVVAAHRARRRLDLPDQRPRGARPRRAAAVRRRGVRAAFRRAGRTGADRRADRGNAEGAARPARRGGRHGRALCAAPRGRAETARRRGQSGAARRCHRDPGGADRDA